MRVAILLALLVWTNPPESCGYAYGNVSWTYLDAAGALTNYYSQSVPVAFNGIDLQPDPTLGQVLLFNWPDGHAADETRLSPDCWPVPLDVDGKSWGEM